MKKNSRLGSANGFALPVVLLMLAAMSVMALRLSQTSQGEIAIVQAYAAEAKARHAADAGYATLIAATDGGRVPPSSITLDSGGLRVVVTATPESGRIDLNAARPDMIGGLMSVLGADAARVGQLVDQIVAMRAREDAPLLRTTEGLLQFDGMDLALLERMSPFVTVHNGTAGIDLRTAPREVLMSLPGLSEKMVDEVIGARAGQDELPRDLRALLRSFRTRSRPIYRVRSAATAPDGTSYVREAVVDLGDPRLPLILDWRRSFRGQIDRPPGG